MLVIHGVISHLQFIIVIELTNKLDETFISVWLRVVKMTRKGYYVSNMSKSKKESRMWQRFGLQFTVTG